MIFPEPKIILTERTKEEYHSGRQYTEQNIDLFTESQILSDFKYEFYINGKKVKSNKPASRYCFKYKYLYYKFEFDIPHHYKQNQKEKKVSKEILLKDKIYFSTLLGYQEGELFLYGKKFTYSYSIHKFEKIKNAKHEDVKSKDLINSLAKKYELYDVGSIWNWGYRKYGNELIPFIYDLGV